MLGKEEFASIAGKQEFSGKKSVFGDSIFQIIKTLSFLLSKL